MLDGLIKDEVISQIVFPIKKSRINKDAGFDVPIRGEYGYNSIFCAFYKHTSSVAQHFYVVYWLYYS